MNSATIYKLLAWSFALACSVQLAGCKQENDPVPGPPVTPPAIGTATALLTRGDQSALLTKGDVPIIAEKETGHPLIFIDSTTRYQEVEGFGAALTGSSAYLIDEELSFSQSVSLLEELFDHETGIGISYLRLTMGASDFSLRDFTYDDMPSGQTDFDLSNFSLADDEDDVVPVMKRIVSVNPSIRVMGSPWSPPAWMKTNGNLKGGKLRADAYAVYAQYFAKYIEAMEEEGITIDAVTPQNEPLHFTANYPCMEMQANEQLAFIRDHLGPTLQLSAPNTKIIVYDHNWDVPAYPVGILNDPAAKQYVAGSAFHAYAGNVSAMSYVHDLHPDKGLYFTEISGGDWATNFGDNLQWNMRNIFIGTMNNWSKTALLWNLALDDSDGPQNNGCSDCRGVVTIGSGGTITRNVEYYSIGHFSKYVRPGAVRIASSLTNGGGSLLHVAFLNPDGSKVVVVSNDGSTEQAFTARIGERQIDYSLGARSVVTLRWD